ncbi:MAG TPA: metal-sulfur cluster assembly factor [Gammaproteobacteria bacterium]|nr:metal-sulfur cluster assembly factor [Gammaproteobacteria bacterium]
MVYRLEIEGGRVRAGITLTTPGCPAQDYILSGASERLQRVPAVESVDVELLWDPPWSPERMSPAAKSFFGIHAKPGRAGSRAGAPRPLTGLLSRLQGWLDQRL